VEPDDGFEEHRWHLFGVAYRMLGNRAEAEDAVQETWLRYAGRRAEVDDLRAWLATVVARICLDVLRSARVRREAYVGAWLPEPIISRLPAGAPAPGSHLPATGGGPAAEPDPAEAAVRADQVSLALLVVLERLTPEQRVAFVLHDVFAVPFEAIAGALDTSVANARQLAARGRRAVEAAEPVRHRADLEEQRRVLDAFMAAVNGGDLAGLARVLAPDVVLVGDGGGLAPSLPRPVHGAGNVGRFLLGLARHARKQGTVYAETVLVNGADLGFVVESRMSYGRGAEEKQLRLLIAPVVAGGRVVALYHVLNPEKLVHAPHPDRTGPSWPPADPDRATPNSPPADPDDGR
jgi:RNA polymerase sigma-70 factor (ECF subfamily)